jgi:hypothetical protein
VRFRGIGRLSTERCTDLAAARIDRSVGLEDLELLPGGLNPMPAKEFPHGSGGNPRFPGTVSGVDLRVGESLFLFC